MSSSIEEYFQPPEWATKEEVIKAAQHYINYWKLEATHRNAQWLTELKRASEAERNVEYWKMRHKSSADMAYRLAVEKDKLQARIIELEGGQS